MQSITEKQILEWKEELKVHKERLEQAQAVVQQETRFISMVFCNSNYGFISINAKSICMVKRVS